MKRNLNYLSLCLIASLLCCLSVTSCASNANGQSASRVLTVNKIERKEIPFSTENAIVVEAENGDCYGVKIDSQRENFSGSGYVSFPSYDQGILELPVSVPAAGDYCMFLHLLNEDENTDNPLIPEKIKRFQLEQENGDTTKILTSQRLPVANKFTDVMANCVIAMKQGETCFYVTGMQGVWQLDYVTLVPATQEMKIAAAPSRSLINKNATKEAIAVYDYLCDMQGKGILSGQQMYSRQPEMKAIFSVTGKYPAILGIDLIDYSPSRVSHGTRGTTALDAIKWWKNGELVTCCWHWNAPMDLVDKDEDGKRWYEGFRPTATTFDFATALNNPDSKEYKAIINDIDAIAVPLKKMQDGGLAILWRPLHEASGGWFWWGASGSDAYVKLYRLMYDRLTNYHNINNLIWVWNGQNVEWYPGDDVVDIISEDCYPGSKEYITNEVKLSDVRSASVFPKLVAMSENGTLPNIDEVARDKIPWSWFCTWNGSFVSDEKGNYVGKDTEESVFVQYYKNPYVITRDELPSFVSKEN